MAKIVAGFASSHTPLMSLPGQDWAKRAEDDKRNRELIRPSDGAHVSYDDLLASADPKIAREIDEEVFVKNVVVYGYQRCFDDETRCFHARREHLNHLRTLPLHTASATLSG